MLSKHLHAAPSNAGWRLSLHDEDDETDLSGSGQHEDSISVASIVDLELAKAWRALSLPDRAAAEAFARKCLAAPSAEHLTSCRGEPQAFRAAVRAAMARGGARLRGSITANLALGARLSLAVIMATALLAWTALVLLSEGRRLRPRRVRALAVMHGELSTRTRHLLRALQAEHASGEIILVGRPRASLASLRQAVRCEFGFRARLIRCFEPRDVIAAALHLPRTVKETFDAARAYAARSRDLAGIVYRISLGRASEAWCARHQPQANVAVFAHTGAADTVLFEQALQRGGIETVHYAHGVSHGLNFHGVSNLGVFQCGHDARWHARLGGYQRTIALPAAPPLTLTPGRRKLLVLSNLVHPMNASYRQSGTELERRFIELVKASVDAVGWGPARVTWRPHPVLYDLPHGVIDSVRESVATAGFELWGPERRADDIADFEIALSTPSTAAIDMLRLGLPVVVCFAEPPFPGVVYGVFPNVAADPAALASVLSDRDRIRLEFRETWARVGPAQAPRWSDFETAFWRNGGQSGSPNGAGFRTEVG
jgi:hypothetical protein